jgi:XisI protein
VDKLTKYRQIIQDILLEYSQYKPALNDLEIEAIFDTKRDHYQVVSFGWEGTKYVHYCLIHIDIKAEKIWLQLNMTEQEIAEDLVKLGIPSQDIVIGFHPPNMRKLTNYAVG